MLIRKKLTADEFSPPYVRYNESCDCTEFSPDGGTTWLEQPELDPRHGVMYQLPPTDDQCRAAEGMTSLVRMLVDERLANTDAASLAAAILGVVVFLPGFNILFAIILAFVTLALEIASEVLEEAFEGDTYDQIRCIFFCNIDADGVMDQEAFDATYEQLIDLNAVARTWVQYVMNLAGPVGMTNAGIQFEAAADCDECECEWCYTWDFTVNDGGFTPSLGDYGIYYPGEGWRQTPDQGLIITKSFPVNAIITKIVYTGQSSDGSGYTWAAQLRLGGSVVFSQANPGAGVAYTTEFEPSEIEADLVLLNPYAGSTSSQLITSCTLYGIETNPFGADNC